MRRIIAVITVILAFSLAGCSTLQVTRIPQKKDLSGFKTAYVARHSKSTNNIELYIQEALAQRGMQVRVGPDDVIPRDVDIYLKYIDRWQWDMMMYLNSLKILVYDAKNDELLRSAEYRNSFFHSFPNPTTKTKQVIDALFQE